MEKIMSLRTNIFVLFMSWLPDWLTGFDREAYEAGLRADELNRARNAELLARGDITEADFQASERRFVEGQFDPDAEIERAFDQGLEEGAANVTAVVSKPFEIAGAGAGAVLKAVPWWIWLAGLGFLLFALWPVIAPTLATRRK